MYNTYHRGVSQPPLKEDKVSRCCQICIGSGSRNLEPSRTSGGNGGAIARQGMQGDLVLRPGPKLKVVQARDSLHTAVHIWAYDSDRRHTWIVYLDR